METIDYSLAPLLNLGTATRCLGVAPSQLFLLERDKVGARVVHSFYFRQGSS